MHASRLGIVLGSSNMGMLMTSSHFDMALSVISRIVTIPRFDKPFVWMKQARVSHTMHTRTSIMLFAVPLCSRMLSGCGFSA